MKLELSQQIFEKKKKPYLSNFIKIRLVWLLIVACRQTKGQKIMTKLKVTFLNFAEARKVLHFYVQMV
jgi:hypothetical protein